MSRIFGYPIKGCSRIGRITPRGFIGTNRPTGLVIPVDAFRKVLTGALNADGVF